jgi:hypothetical protein
MCYYGLTHAMTTGGVSCDTIKKTEAAVVHRCEVGVAFYLGDCPHGRQGCATTSEHV